MGRNRSTLGARSPSQNPIPASAPVKRREIAGSGFRSPALEDLQEPTRLSLAREFGDERRIRGQLALFACQQLLNRCPDALSVASERDSAAGFADQSGRRRVERTTNHPDRGGR